MRSAPGRLEPEATGGTSSGPGRATCHPVCDRKEGSHGGRAAARAPLLPAGFMSAPSPRARPAPRPWRRSSDQSLQPPPSWSLRCRKGGREQRGRGWGRGRGRGAAPHAAGPGTLASPTSCPLISRASAPLHVQLMEEPSQGRGHPPVPGSPRSIPAPLPPLLPPGVTALGPLRPHRAGCRQHLCPRLRGLTHPTPTRRHSAVTAAGREE